MALGRATLAWIAACGTARKGWRQGLLSGWALACALSAQTPGAWALDEITLQRDERTLKIAGQVLVEAQDGGLLVKTPDGELWAVTPEELVTRTSDDRPFVPWESDALAARVLEQ